MHGVRGLIAQEVGQRGMVDFDLVRPCTDKIVGPAPQIGRNRFAMLDVVTPSEGLPREIVFLNWEIAGQPFHALFNMLLVVPCLMLGLVFHPLLLLPSVYAVLVIYYERENRKHREIVDAIRQHGAPKDWKQ